jgi:hypothetical protein
VLSNQIYISIGDLYHIHILLCGYHSHSIAFNLQVYEIEEYKNRGGNSGVICFEINDDSITVQFRDN